MKTKIACYSDSGDAYNQYKERSDGSCKGFAQLVAKKMWTYTLSQIAMWIPVSNIRVILHRLRGVQIGKRVFIGANVIMDNVYPEYIILENDCILSGNNIILSHSMPRKHFKNVLEAFVAPVTVKRGAWISAGAIILPGITIGEFSVVSAGSVVTCDVPPYSVVRGNPAEVISRFNPKWITPVK